MSIEKFTDNECSDLSKIYGGGKTRRSEATATNRTDTYTPDTIEYRDDGTPKNSNRDDFTLDSTVSMG